MGFVLREAIVCGIAMRRNLPKVSRQLMFWSRPLGCSLEKAFAHAGFVGIPALSTRACEVVGRVGGGSYHALFVCSLVVFVVDRPTNTTSIHTRLLLWGIFVVASCGFSIFALRSVSREGVKLIN